MSAPAVTCQHLARPSWPFCQLRDTVPCATVKSTCRMSDKCEPTNYKVKSAAGHAEQLAVDSRLQELVAHKHPQQEDFSVEAILF